VEPNKPHGRLIPIGCSLGVALVVAFGLWIYRVATQAEYRQGTVGEPLKWELGFQIGSPYYTIGGEKGVELFVIESVAPGGIFDKARVRSGDFPVAPPGERESFNEFFRRLEEARGGTATFDVVNGGDGPELEHRTRRTIRVNVPAAREAQSTNVE